uniref:Uncharacterized protein n=1 Tax=Panagrolaimus davidi TaxID=227884 RepID=A0A914R587_9BILA
MNTSNDDLFNCAQMGTPIAKFLTSSPKIPRLHIAAYTTEARTALDRQLSYPPPNSVQRSSLSHVSKPSNTAPSKYNKSESIRLLPTGTRSIISPPFSKLQKKKKSLTFDSAEHVKIIPNRQELEEDEKNWTPNGTHRTKKSICSDDVQNSNIPHYQQEKQKQPASNNNYAPFSLFSYTPIFQTNGQPQNLNSNRLFSLPNYRSTSTFPRSNIINDDKRPYGFSTNNDDLPTLPLRPPIRRYNLNDYDSTFSRKNFHDSANEFSDFSTLPRRPVVRNYSLNGNMNLPSNVMNTDERSSNGFSLSRQSGSGGQASNSNKRRANDNDNNEFEAPKNKNPKLAAAGRKDAAAQGKIILQENNQSNGAKNDSNNDDLLKFSRSPQVFIKIQPRRIIFLNGRRSNVMNTDDLSKLPRRPPLRKQSSKPYYERFPLIKLNNNKSLKPAQSCLDVLWKMFWGPKRRTKQFESC